MAGQLRLFVTGLLLFSGPSAFAVHDGTDSNKSGVGMITKADGTEVGTASEIKARCLLTVAHAENYSLYFQAQKPYSGAGRKFVPVMRTLANPAYDVGTEPNSYADLALMWTTPFGCDHSSTSYVVCDEDDNVAYTPTWNILTIDSGEPTRNTVAPMYGYGLKSPTVGIREKRSGNMKVDVTIAHQDPDMGASIKFIPVSGDVRSCAGDSGGPHLEDGKIIGVNRDGEPEGCDHATGNIYNIVVGLWNGNDKFVKLTGTGAAAGEAAKFCRKKIKDVRASKKDTEGQGIDENSVEGDHYDPVTLESEASVIDCGEGCFDDSYAGEEDEGIIEITLTASNSADFQSWENDSDYPDIGTCPCAGSTSTTCVIKAKDADWKQENLGLACVAEYDTSVSRL